MQYPEGAIKTFGELLELEKSAINRTIYYASATFGIENLKILSISLAQMIDGNIGKLNNYNDWFMFADEVEAKAWAKK